MGFSSHSMALASSTCPCAPDIYATYQAAEGTAVPFSEPGAFGGGSYASTSRTMGITATDDSDSETVRTITVDFWEPLLASPFSFTQDGLCKGLVGINSLQLSTQISYPARMLSLDLGTGGGASTVTGVTLANHCKSSR